MTFGVKSTNGNCFKLVINNASRQYEKGYLCVNSMHTDVWVKMSDIYKIEASLIADGYERTESPFK